MIDQSIHTLDYFCYLVGKSTEVKAQMCNYSLDQVIEVEDPFTARLSFANGTYGIFFATNGYCENSAPIFKIVFEKWIARYIDGQLWVNGQIVAGDDVTAVGKAYWGSSHAVLLKRFYDEHKYFRVSDVANTMETVFAMYDSAKSDCVRMLIDG